MNSYALVFYINGYKHLTSHVSGFPFTDESVKVWPIPLLIMSRQLGCRPLTLRIPGGGGGGGGSGLT